MDAVFHGCVLLQCRTAGPCDDEQGGPAGSARRCSVNAGLLAVLGSVLESNDAVDEREQRVVAAHADVVARTDRRPTLPNDDRAGEHRLTVAALDAEPLAGAVTTVSGAAHSLLVSHRSTPTLVR